MNHWSNHWLLSRTVSSFSEGEVAQTYANDVSNFWSQNLAFLGKEAVIVDVGSGNGAAALMISEWAKKNGKKWQVHGVDIATINPVKSLSEKPEISKQLESITFHSETDMQKLPFADNSVDCVVSQFGFEYGESEAALVEALRVLKPGGKIVALAQHKKSQLVKEAGQGAEIFQHILNTTPLFLQADLMLRLAAMQMEKMSFEEWQKNQACLASRRTTEWIMQTLKEKFNKPEEHVWLNEIFGRVLELINFATTTEKAVQAAEYLMIAFNMLQDHRLRLIDHGEAALTAANTKKWLKAAEKAKASAEVTEFNAGEQLFAWQFIASK
ncbi:hypothetical protein CWE13_09010 [Aliidiomarina shirensis]|uniref:Methyltransferase type 11 domain-containing protein n=1 Tax=Aliidiomarina shirensis TaxID=1048642 RepID=A0A432WT75_9GAMM|nr:class I SAM-dependent methyltransferase [Aliidiomarina shirensis]RUO36973.1 hypothetical protein CWE13_09010 [Aliidiomarina shirensis]